VSVVLPVRDAAGTLDEAVGSVLASRGLRFELLCVDDGSTDATPERLAQWADRDRRVRVLTRGPRGIVAALACGLSEARAPCVARMDADDRMHPDRLRLQVDWLDANPEAALVGCQVECVREGGLGLGYRLYEQWVNALCTHEEIAREAFVECPLPHPTWTFRRAAVLAAGGYREEPWPEDLALLYRLLAQGARLGKIPRRLHSWRDHEARLSRRDARYGRLAFARAKAHFLPQLHPMSAAVIWGAGKTGRRFARLLAEQGVPVRAMLDIRPERQGTRWRGIPIFSPAELPVRAPAWRAAGWLVLGAVATRGARGEIRRELGREHLREGEDFLLVA
jgi:hypothetical protein